MTSGDDTSDSENENEMTPRARIRYLLNQIDGLSSPALKPQPDVNSSPLAPSDRLPRAMLDNDLVGSRSQMPSPQFQGKTILANGGEKSHEGGSSDNANDVATKITKRILFTSDDDEGDEEGEEDETANAANLVYESKTEEDLERKPRASSKRALQNIARETQRIERGLALAPNPVQAARVDIRSVFARFHFDPSEPDRPASPVEEAGRDSNPDAKQPVKVDATPIDAIPIANAFDFDRGVSVASKELDKDSNNYSGYASESGSELEIEYQNNKTPQAAKSNTTAPSSSRLKNLAKMKGENLTKQLNSKLLILAGKQTREARMARNAELTEKGIVVGDAKRSIEDALSLENMVERERERRQTLKRGKPLPSSGDAEVNGDTEYSDDEEYVGDQSDSGDEFSEEDDYVDSPKVNPSNTGQNVENENKLTDNGSNLGSFEFAPLNIDLGSAIGLDTLPANLEMETFINSPGSESESDSIIVVPKRRKPHKQRLEDGPRAMADEELFVEVNEREDLANSVGANFKTDIGLTQIFENTLQTPKTTSGTVEPVSHPSMVKAAGNNGLSPSHLVNSPADNLSDTQIISATQDNSVTELIREDASSSMRSPQEALIHFEPVDLQPDSKLSLVNKSKRLRLKVVDEPPPNREKDVRGIVSDSREALQFMEEQAVESDDEYAGIGGASDDDNADNLADLKELEQLIDDSNDVEGNEEDVTRLYQQQEIEGDEKMVQNLMKDIANGNLRRKRGANIFGLDDSDEESDEEREERRRRYLEIMRERLLEDESLQALMKNAKYKGFLSTIEQATDVQESFLDADEIPPNGNEDEIKSVEASEEAKSKYTEKNRRNNISSIRETLSFLSEFTDETLSEQIFEDEPDLGEGSQHPAFTDRNMERVQRYHSQQQRHKLSFRAAHLIDSKQHSFRSLLSTSVQNSTHREQKRRYVGYRKATRQQTQTTSTVKSTADRSRSMLKLFIGKPSLAVS